MPTLNWIGKEAVVKHHKEVPYRLLEPVPEMSHGDPNSGNLIVQGDNLHALKALLPRYAGKVKCIYIDPPYNTGNENWVYNDNVNSPEIKKWLHEVVGKEGEDLTRHDKWLCMMYPRLVLLRKFLTEDGIIFVSIDDNEVSPLKFLMDEIFGPDCYKNTIAIRRGIKNVQAQFEDLSALALGHEYILLYSKKSNCRLPKLMLNHEDIQPGKWDTFWRGTDRPTMRYEIFGYKPDTGQWRWEEVRGKKAIQNYEEYLKKYSSDMSIDEWFLDTLTSRSIKLDFVRQSEEGSIQYYVPPRSGKLLSDNWMDILLTGNATTFETEKNVILIQRIINWVTNGQDLILDSFAGSGTTGHAVLNQNIEDGGVRKFILVEMDEKVVTDITVKRMRKILDEASSQNYEMFNKTANGFQFSKLSNEPLFDSNGEIRSDVKFAQLAEFVWFVETGTGFSGKADSPLLGTYEGRGIYLLYNGILKDRSVNGGNILTSAVFSKLPEHDGSKVVYAAACRLGNARLDKLGIIFKQTPYELKV